MHLKTISQYLFVFICFCFSANAAEKVTLELNDIDWPPYFVNQPSSPLKGIAKELLAHCINPEKYQKNFTVLPIKRTHIYMHQGVLDISIYSYKKERESFVFYSKEPMFTSGYGFVVRADSDIKIKQLSDLSPYVIGNLAGLSHTPEILTILKNKRQNNQVIDGYSIDAMFDQLLAHTPRFDLMINAKETFYWRAKELGITRQVKMLDYPIQRKPYFLTLSKASKNINNKQQFLDDFDNCLINLKSGDKYHKILAKYGMEYSQ